MLLKQFFIRDSLQLSLIPSDKILLNHEHFRESNRSVSFINPKPPFSVFAYFLSFAIGIPRITKLSMEFCIVPIKLLSGDIIGPR